MNGIEVMRGVYDADFVGDTQHATATRVVADATRAEQLQTLRANIRGFREREAVDGHVTVIWSASVERPSVEYDSADALLDAIDADDREVSPSLLYAAAALLEGCSFVNGGSQNTVQRCLLELADRSPS
eukprot:2950510-Prymnesium_polylepis.2